MNKKISLCTNEKTGALGAEVEVQTLSQLEALTRQGPWSPYLFNRVQQYKKDGKPFKIMRNKKNFREGHFFAIDIDQGMTLEDAKKILINNKMSAFINTSQSHRLEGNGDRFRIVFALSEPITTPKQILGTFEYLKTNYFPTLDEACKDEARFFKGSKELILIQEGDQYVSLTPISLDTAAINNIVLTGEGSAGDTRLRLSMQTQLFLSSAQPSGERHEPLVKACMNAGAQGWSKEQFKELCSKFYSINPWLKEEKHQNCIDDIFDNERWGGNAPFLYTEDQKQIAGAVQSKWTALWLKNNKVRCTYDGMMLVDGSAVNRSKITRDLRLEAARNNLNMSDKLFEDLMDEFVEDNRQEYLEVVKRRINNPVKDVDPSQELDKFLTHLCGDNKKETDGIILRHFIWNIKRRMNGELPYREVMPIIQGFQGVGKSYTIKEYFLKPLEDLVKQSTFKQLEDSRELKLLSDNFVLFFDEMSYAAISDIDNIKRLITETSITVRRMRETSHDYLPKNAQFIGTTNRSLTSLISDYTGMRRFYSIECRDRESIKTPITEYHKGFDGINFLSIWQSVDPTQPAPIIEMLEEIEAIQQGYTANHPIDDWIDNSGDVEIVDGEWSSGKILLDMFNSYQTSQRINPIKFSKFIMESKYNNIINKRRTNKGVEYNLKLKQKDREGEY